MTMKKDISDAVPQDWCKFSIVNPTSLSIGVLEVLVVLVLLVMHLKSNSLRKRYLEIESIDSTQKKLKNLILLSIALTLIKSIFAILQYSLVNEQNSNSEKLIYYSALFDFNAAVGAFVINTILLNIFCIWSYNTFCEINVYQLNYVKKQQLNSTFNMINKAKGYSWFRLLYLLPFVVCQIVLIVYPQNGQYTSLFIGIVIGLQALLIVQFYTYGVFKIQKLRKFLNISPILAKKLFFQYLMFLIGCISRCTMNLLFYIGIAANVFGAQMTQYCHAKSNPSLLWYLYYFPGQFLSHELIIATFLVIYWPNNQNFLCSTNNKKKGWLSTKESSESNSIYLSLH